MVPGVISVHVGQPQWIRYPGQPPLHTAMGKQPVEGRVAVGELGLDGDGHADLRFHGGPLKAVLCYSADHYPAWQAELGREKMAWGFFGENLTVSGWSEATVCLGDLVEAGSVRLRVTQPREPCDKLSRFRRIPDLEARTRASGRTGWYLAVEQSGQVEAGAEMRLVERPAPEWNLARMNEVLEDRQNRAAMLELAACRWLNSTLRRRLTERAGRLVQESLFPE